MSPLKIGCGTALVGIVASKLGGRVTISDGHKSLESLKNAQKNLFENELENVKQIILDWGILDSNVLNLGLIDIILASDCFYDSKGDLFDLLFKSILMTFNITFGKKIYSGPIVSWMYFMFIVELWLVCVMHFYRFWGYNGDSIFFIARK